MTQRMLVEIRIESEFGDYSARDIERALNKAFLTSADFYVTEQRLTKRALDGAYSRPLNKLNRPQK